MRRPIIAGNWKLHNVITSYSIHYTKLYDPPISIFCTSSICDFSPLTDVFEVSIILAILGIIFLKKFVIGKYSPKGARICLQYALSEIPSGEIAIKEL